MRLRVFAAADLARALELAASRLGPPVPGRVNARGCDRAEAICLAQLLSLRSRHHETVAG